ncbi:WXG100 family type VII secretion target [Streptacidiphilus sp. PAMC 29251]
MTWAFVFFGNETTGAVLNVLNGADNGLAPTGIAHRALGEMFDGGAPELRRIAAELSILGAKMDDLGKEIATALGRLSWHGTASDAFVGHARTRVRELTSVADSLDGLGRSVERLADSC